MFRAESDARRSPNSDRVISQGTKASIKEKQLSRALVSEAARLLTADVEAVIVRDQRHLRVSGAYEEKASYLS